MAAKLLTSWENFSKDSGVPLESGGTNDNYFIFNGINLTDDDVQSQTVKIGIYQTNDNKVYAFASTDTQAENIPPTSTNITETTQNEPEDENNSETPEETPTTNATLIASGTGTLGTDKKITGIAITLQGGESVETFNKLAFGGDAITDIKGSDSADTVYIIGKASDNDTNAISNSVKLDFQKGEDTVIFTNASTVSQISGGG
ncbi:MAG: hypothetical protein IKN43_00100 [Selenomonadaceae bacterium]|nr:hypothetical protein [Selenomonadaceae bacterium]